MVIPLRLGVNIDHVATIRNARGEVYPDPVRAACLAEESGADGITAHLREDRRHIKDDDVFRLNDQCALPLNLEIAATDEMLAIALDVKPSAVCIVPERREEVTTEGGLDVITHADYLRHYVESLSNAGIRVSLFIDPVIEQVKASKAIGAPVVELHTGHYSGLIGAEQDAVVTQIKQVARMVSEFGMECHAGHGLTFDNVTAIAALESIAELNIGHFLVGEALFSGLGDVIYKMKEMMKQARC